MTLDVLNVGEKAKVIGYRRDKPQILRRILEMGLVRGAEVEVVRFSPMGDPMEIAVKGYLLSVRLSEAALVEIDSNEERDSITLLDASTTIDLDEK